MRVSMVRHSGAARVTLECYTCLMPTKHQRIPVTNDPDLADALRRVESLFQGAPAARIVHDLAIRGAQAMEREQDDRAAAIERLIERSTTRTGEIDWDVLENIDELAWARD
jgi:hypothetical protein